ALPTDPDTGKEIKLFDPTIPPKFECGGGCGVSTAGDYARFIQMLLNRGTLDGPRILGRKTIEFMTPDPPGTPIAPGPADSPGPGYRFGLGFAGRKDTGVAPMIGSAGDYNWGGAFGTGFWVDPKEELAVVFERRHAERTTRRAVRALERQGYRVTLSWPRPQARSES